MILCRHRLPARQRVQGFSLIELSVVLVVMAILAGAVMAGVNVYRQAMVQRMYGDFVMGWRTAYLAFVANSFGVQPGDNGNAPAYAVGGAVNTPLCGDALINALQARGIALPQGRTAGSPDRYVYPDKQGIPHEVRVCMMTVPWTLPGPAVGTFQNAPRHVLRLTGLTPEAAASFDVMTDGALDASVGEFREQGREAGLGTAAAAWTADENATMGGVAEGQSVELTAYLLVGR